jgi:hypothetical protein
VFGLQHTTRRDQQRVLQKIALSVSGTIVFGAISPREEIGYVG